MINTMKVLFFIGWGLLLIAFAASAAEMAAHAVGGARGAFISFYTTMASMWPNATGSIQNVVGAGLLKTVFALPGWLTFGLPGAILVWTCRPNKDSVSQEDQDSLSLFDELNEQAKRDGYTDESKEEFFDDHKEIEAIDSDNRNRGKR